MRFSRAYQINRARKIGKKTGKYVVGCMDRVKGKRVIVGMSGGVDSSVAAFLLKQAGAEVHGVFMKNWEEEADQGYCTAEEDLRDAKAVCETLTIPLHVVNFAKNYKDSVFSYFLATLKDGFTPNPDVLCNKEIKFKAFLNYAYEFGADLIATGHYARLRRDEKNTYLLKGVDASKDQSYFLHLLNQAQLKNTVFPIGDYQKETVREIALEHELITFDKKDSTGICFIGERDFTEFIMQYLPTHPGPMNTPEGEKVGEHQGLAFYTIGQRQGLGIGGRRNSTGEPWFVVDKNLHNNELVVAQGNHPALFGQTLIARDLHLIADYSLASIKGDLTAKIRYRQQDEPCEVTFLSEDKIKVTFTNQQRAITPGQSIVFYRGDECLGGAVIERKGV